MRNFVGYALGFIFIFVIAEIFSRTLFPHFSTNQISGYVDENQFISKGINQYFINSKIEGLLHRDPIVSEPYKKRILFLGDSVTAGYGVNYQNTYYSILERNLRKLGYDVKSEALAIYGGSIDNYINSFSNDENSIDTYELVIYQFNLNDIRDFSDLVPDPSGDFLRKEEIESSFIKKIIYLSADFRYRYLNQSVFFRAAQHYAGQFARNTSGSCIDRSFDSLGEYTFTFGSMGFEEISEKFWEVFEEKFPNFISGLDSKKLIIFISPISLYLSHENHNNHVKLDLSCSTIDPFKRLKRISDEMNINLVNTIPHFVDYDRKIGLEGNESNLFFEYDSNHPNELGHFLMAEILLNPILSILRNEEDDQK